MEWSPVITVVGESLVDLIEDSRGERVAHPGGSPANVAVALARLGRPANLLTQVGDDPYGRLLLDHLRDNGVVLASGTVLDAIRTSTAVTSLDPAGKASYTFDIGWERFPSAGFASVPQTVRCVHTGSLATVLSPGADDVLTMARGVRDTATVSFDPNCRPTLTPDPDPIRARVDAFVAASDIVKASLDDVEWLYPRRHYRDVAREWLDRGAALVAITLGGDGAWAVTPHREAAMAPWPVAVRDTIGAGDAFTAGLLCGLGEADLLGAARRDAVRDIDDATLTEVLAFASEVAALTCARRGADPPRRVELGAARARKTLPA